MPDELIVRDGRISEEKLAELRAIGGETESLDFKRTANLDVPRSRLALVKDVVSLANTGGGFLVIGCDDQGRLASDMPPVTPSQWEPANLMGIVNKYVSVPIALNAASHVVEGRVVVILAVQATMRNLPVPFAADGEWYEEAGKPKFEFRKGQVWVRSGPRNVTLGFHDWDRILAEHNRNVREQVRGEGQALVDRVLEAISREASTDSNLDGGAPKRHRGATPLVPGMSWESLDAGIDDALEAPRDTRLRRYIAETTQQITDRTSDRGTRQRSVAEMVNLAIRASQVDRDEVVGLAIGGLHRAYGALDDPPAVRYLSGVRDETITNYWLDIAIRMLDLGAYFVRKHAWAKAREVYAQPYSPEGDGGYVFQSWLRHAQVQGSRAELLQDEQGRATGAVYLSFAREAAVEEPRLRPDLPEVAGLPLGTAPEGRDPLLDSIARFDALSMVMSEAGVTSGHAGHYPSFAALRTERALPILERIATDQEMRTAAFPGISNREIADALVRTIESAHTESWRTAGVWFVPTSGNLGHFIAEHRTPR